MKDSLLFLPLILVIALVLALGGSLGSWLISIGICAAIIVLFILIISLKEKQRQKLVEHIRNTYPLAYKKFDTEHHLSHNIGQGLYYWNSEQRNTFFSLKENEWAVMQQQEEDRIANEKSIDKLYAEIESNYPIGLKYWLKKNHFKVIKKKDVNMAKGEIQAYDEAYSRLKAFKNWEEEQSKFSEGFLADVKIVLPRISTLKHKVDYTIPGLLDKDGQISFTVYCSFFQPFCLDESLDYSLYPGIKKNSDYMMGGSSGEIESDMRDYYCYYGSSVSSILELFFNCGFADENLLTEEGTLLFFDDNENERIDPTLFSGVCNSITEGFSRLGNCTIYKLQEALDNKVAEIKKNVIIIGHVINTLKLEEQCRRILSLYQNNAPHIYYMSIYHELSSDTMRRMIDRKKEILAAEGEKKH